MADLSLLPRPQQLTLAGGRCTLRSERRIVLDVPPAAALLPAVRRLRRVLGDAGLGCERGDRPADAPDGITIALQVAPAEIGHPQGYRLTISPSGVSVVAREAAGVFYAVCTLAQVIEQCRTDLPCLRVDDWPDFEARGVMLDVSRDKVPRIETLLALVEMLAGWKINQLQLYTEHTFAYRNHPDVWADASPLTGGDIRTLDAFCRERCIELVPNQNSLGHMERWLMHPRYRPLAELSGEALPLGPREPGIWRLAPFRRGCTLCPGDPGSLALVRSLYDELLPHFTSKTVNVGCDEPFELDAVPGDPFYLGEGRSRAACARRGVARVYLDYLRRLHRILQERGYTMQYWADVAARYPEILPDLPRDAIALAWGYDADYPFAEAAMLAETGLPFYVCPGTSSWGSIAGRTDAALANLRQAALVGRRHGARGYLITDWGEDGHRQFLPISYLGFAVGAALAWAGDANRDLDVPGTLDRHAFRDRAAVMGRLACDLGNVAQMAGSVRGSVLNSLLRYTLDQLRAGYQPFPRPTTEALRRTLAAIDATLAPLPCARMDRPDADLIAHEYALTARLMSHACRRALLIYDLGGDVSGAAQDLARGLEEFIADYRRTWLARNRPGGLKDSVARLEFMRGEYLAVSG